MKKHTLENGETISVIDELTADYVYNEIYKERVYLENGIDIKEGDIVFDVGANIGVFSRFISQEAPNLKIFAFEPIPAIFDCLKSNVSDIPAEIKIYDVGLGEKSGSIEFFYFPKVSADSAAVRVDFDRKVDFYVENYKESICKDMPIARIIPKFLRRAVVKAGLKSMYKYEKVTCQIRTISEIIKENNLECIDLMKIDAENYEKQVFNGILDQDWNKIQQLAIEVHTHIKGGENLLEEITELLNSKGFSTSLGKESRETLMGVYMLYGRK
jgi:FkbM family methyltransferase